MTTTGLSRRNFLANAPLAAAATLIAPSTALALSPGPELVGVDALRRPMWNMAMAFWRNDPGHWQVTVVPEKGLGVFILRNDLPGRGVFFTDLQA